ncbi:MAG: alkaline phosphatase family protein [Mediterranea massiliensis]|nr:alkaline phosphatase family protein [Mediterranea massiliensis]
MKKGLITSILALTFSSIQAQPLTSVPKLVVTLTIDQLRSDYMEAFSSLYGEGGFKRLMKEGKIYTQAGFTFQNIDRASAIATLYSGATPSLNGIVSENWLDINTLRPINCVDDNNFMGNYTTESSSPSQLLVSTIADELKIASSNKGLVYAIAPFRDAAILSAGHAGNCALWLNEDSGKWCSTTYYGDFPWWVSQYNDRWSPDFRIKELEWTPSYPAERYKYLPTWRTEAFKYKFDGGKLQQYRKLTTSPLINDEVNLLAEELLNKSTIGKDETPDLLALTYYAGTFNHRSPQEYGMELQDTYVRLDRSIETLLNMLEQKIGLQNILLCISSTGYSEPEAPDSGIYRIPGGEFHLNRCATLLNIYLMATYGTGQYVDAYYDRQIYLNHKLIEEKQLDLSEIQQKSEAFLTQFSGVNEVYSAHRVLIGDWSPEIEKIRNGYHRHRSGDLVIEILPGWTIVQENSTDNRVIRTAHIPTPLILMGNNIKAERIISPIHLERLAPTITSALRIRSPNACRAIPLF